VRIPRWLPPVLYALVVVWLFRAFIFSSDMLFGEDTLSLGYMARKFYADALRSGSFPLWNPLILGGTPFLESLAGGDSLYPTSLLLLIMEPHRALGWKLVLHIFLAGLFMFAWVRTLGCSRAAALIAGLAYGLAPFLVSFVFAGHDGKIFVISLAPLLFWAAERTFTRAGLLPFVIVALVIALVIFTTHFQMAYFLFGGVGLYYLFRVWQTWRGSDEGPVEGAKAQAPEAAAAPRGARAAGTRLALFLTAAVAGAAVTGVQLIPAADYVTKYSRRTATTVNADAAANVAYSSSFSLNPEELLSYVAPEFAGTNAGGRGWAYFTYWGRNGLKNNHEGVGLVVLLLAGLSFFGAPRKGLRVFLLTLGTVALLFALGRHTPVFRIFFEVFPGISLFRAPSQASFLFGFAVVTLAAFGTDRLLAAVSGRVPEESSRRAGRYLWIAAGVVGVLMLLAASGVLLSLWTSVVLRQMADFQVAALERARPFIVRGFFVATLLAAATAATLWAGRKGLLKPAGVIAVLGLLIALDGLRIDQAFVQTLRQAQGYDFRAWAAPDPTTQFLVDRQRQEDPFKVASPFDPQGVRLGMFGVELATGHHPNDLARYRELIGMQGSQGAVNLGSPDLSGMFHGSANVTRLLNVRYLLIPGMVPDSLMALVGWGELNPRIVHQQQFAGGAEVVYQVDALPRARLVAEAEVLPDDQAVARILDPTFDPARTAVLSEAPPVALPGGPAVGDVEWVERGVNRMSLRVRSDGPALLVLADNWFPSWRARVNGEDAPVLRAYHTLRAVPVGAGEQTVELYYDSPLLQRSLMISVAALTLLLAVAALSFIRGRARGAERAAA
jgi:hypothetical protein